VLERDEADGDTLVDIGAVHRDFVAD